MKRTTIALEETLHEQLRLRAVMAGRSMTETVNEVLRVGMGASTQGVKPPRPRWRTFRCSEVLVDIADRDALFAAMEDE